MKGVGQPFRTAARRVDVAGDVELDELLIKGIPVSFTKRGRFHAAALTGIRIEQTANESLFLNATLEVRKTILDRHTRALRQSAYTTENLREQLHLLRNECCSSLRCTNLNTTL